MRLISPEEITFTARISEADLKARIAQEVLEQIGGVDEGGKPRAGVTVKVLRGASHIGGYVVSVSGPTPKLLLEAPA